GLPGGPGRDVDAAHQRADRAPADAQARSLLAPRAPEARRPAPPVPELPAAEGRRGVPHPDQGARPAPLAPKTEGGSLSGPPRNAGADSNLHPSPSTVEEETSYEHR